MRQPLFLQSATHDIVRGCVKTSQTAFGGQLPYQGSLSANYKLCATNSYLCMSSLIYFWPMGLSSKRKAGMSLTSSMIGLKPIWSRTSF